MRRRKVPHDWLSGRYALLLIVLLFVSGMALVFYPRFGEYVSERKETKLLTDWGSAASQLAVPTGEPGAETADSKPDKPLPQWTTVNGVEVLGTVENDRIDMKEPIVRGADADSLKKGAGSVVEGRLPGQPGNFVLASHRSLTFGRHFNRLAELREGDSLRVNTSAGIYRYEVVSSIVVEPDDLSVLENGPEDEATLTLITCTPRKHPTHRLIVKAKLLS